MRRVVVTGMGVVSPIGVGVQAFFHGLESGVSGIDAVTRFDASGFPTRIAAEVRSPLSELDRYRGPLRTALQRDRKSGFGVIAAREAVAMAFGHQTRAPCEPRRLGLSVSAGLELFDVRDLNPYVAASKTDGGRTSQATFAVERYLADALRTDLHAMGPVPADLGARLIREEISARGPYSVNLSACAAGTQALGEAFLAIREGVADIVVAGGYDSMINPLGLGGFCLLEAMSRRNDLGSNASRPFDISRDGFVLGEGSAFFVLEEKELAMRRGATTIAEIEGYGCSLDAYRVTDPQPDGRGAESAMGQALTMARATPAGLDYVNAHGTGTPKNDPVEALALRRLLGPDVERVFVSSTKSQVGHLIGAAGAIEFGACLFALIRQIVPATITLERPDPECQLRHVPKTPVSAEIRRVMSNSLGFGGQNASIVLSGSRAPRTGRTN